MHPSSHHKRFPRCYCDTLQLDLRNCYFHQQVEGCLGREKKNLWGSEFWTEKRSGSGVWSRGVKRLTSGPTRVIFNRDRGRHRLSGVYASVLVLYCAIDRHVNSIKLNNRIIVYLLYNKVSLPCLSMLFKHINLSETLQKISENSENCRFWPFRKWKPWLCNLD